MLHGVEFALWSVARAGRPALQLDSRSMAAGQGVLLGVLGGFRSITADFLWIRMSEACEQQDVATAETWLQLVFATDPEPLQFWLNGARITAYDMPGWRIEADGGRAVVPAGVQQRIIREQAGRALAGLAEARKFHPAAASLWIEQANIELNQLHDPAAAAESYRRASEQPDAPFFAARLHAELLRRLGRKREALAWLVMLHPQLPAAEEAAGADLVLARIRSLERELGVPVEQAYRAAAGRAGQRPALPLISPRNGRSL